jgi:hypothetical protein
VETTVVDMGGSEASTGRVATWPYLVGLGSLTIAAVGFVYAPISGIVYLAVPGILVAAYWALVCKSPARFAVVIAAAALGAGLATGLAVLASFAGDDLVVREWGSMAALLVLPAVGLAVGIPGLLVARSKPGELPIRYRRAE